MPALYKFDYVRLPDRTKRQLGRSVAEPDLHMRSETSLNPAFYAGRALLLAFLGLWLFSALAGQFGVPEKDTLWSDTGLMLGLAILIAGLAYVGLAVRNRYRMTQLLGFTPGEYIFAATLVDARKPVIECIDLSDLRNIEVSEQRYQGFYSHSKFTLFFQDGSKRAWRVNNRQRAAQFGDKLHAMQVRAREAYQRNDLATGLQCDPFYEIRSKNWVLPSAAPQPVPGWRQWLVNPVAVALAAAVVLSPLVWTARNAGADFSMRAQAKALQTEAAYQAYIFDGWFFVDEMRAAIPRVALEEVKKKRSVTALRALLKRYPKAGLQNEVAAEVHALYQASLAKFAAQAATSDPTLLPSMTALLNVLELRGDPVVGIRFKRPSNDAMAEMDARLKKNEARLEGKTIIPAAAHFASDTAAAREARIVSNLQAGFRMIFPNDVLSLQTVGDSDQRLPVLTIDYQIEPSGDMYVSDSGERAFVGLVARFQSGLKVGADVDPWRFNVEVKPPERFEVNSQTRAVTHNGPPDSAVYSVMAERAFDTLAAQMRAAFFRPDSAAARGMKVAEVAN